MELTAIPVKPLSPQEIERRRRLFNVIQYVLCAVIIVTIAGYLISISQNPYNVCLQVQVKFGSNINPSNTPNYWYCDKITNINIYYKCTGKFSGCNQSQYLNSSQLHDMLQKELADSGQNVSKLPNISNNGIP